MYTTLLEQGMVLRITRFDPRHRHKRLFARCEGPFFCSFELTLQNTIYLLKWNRKLCICFAICEIGRMRNMRKV